MTKDKIINEACKDIMKWAQQDAVDLVKLVLCNLYLEGKIAGRQEALEAR